MADRVTLTQIAEITGVSVMTVSNVMKGRPGAADATRERVLLAARDLGYVPAPVTQDPSGQRVGMIGVVMLDLTNQYALEILRGIADALADAELEVLISASYQDGTREFERVDFLTNGVVDGLILVAPELDDPTLALLQARGRPYVVIDPRRLDTPVPRIIVDNYDGTRHAADHLIQLGHQRIAYMQGPPDFESSTVRRKGFNDAMRLSGLNVDESLISVTDFLYVSGRREAERLLRVDPRPTAILAGADILAFAAIDAARGLGLEIPHDVSVVGFDDLPRAEHSFPALTTVHQPLIKMGQLAARIISDQLDGTAPVLERINLQTELVIRATTGISSK